MDFKDTGKRLACVCLVLLAGLCSRACQAQEMPRPYAVRVVYLSPERMAENTDAAVRVRINAIETIRIGTRVYTDAHCEILEAWYGAPPGTGITVRQPGGVHDGLATWAGPLPDWRPGEEWLFALNRPPQGWWTIHGIKQGGFRVENGLALRDFDGFSFTEPPPVELDGGIERIPAGELKRRMTAAHPGDGDLVADARATAAQPPSPGAAAGGLATPAGDSVAPPAPTGTAGPVTQRGDSTAELPAAGGRHEEGAAEEVPASTRGRLLLLLLPALGLAVLAGAAVVRRARRS